MTKLSGINFNNTNRLHLVLAIRIYFDKRLNYPKVYKSSKTPGHIKITSQVPNLRYIIKTIYNYIYKIQLGIYKFLPIFFFFFIYIIFYIHQFFFYIHHFKLKTEVIISCGLNFLSKTCAYLEGYIFCIREKVDT